MATDLVLRTVVAIDESAVVCGRPDAMAADRMRLMLDLDGVLRHSNEYMNLDDGTWWCRQCSRWYGKSVVDDWPLTDPDREDRINAILITASLYGVSP